MTRGACDGGSMKFGFTPGGGGMAGEELDGPSLNLLQMGSMFDQLLRRYEVLLETTSREADGQYGKGSRGLDHIATPYGSDTPNVSRIADSDSNAASTNCRSVFNVVALPKIVRAPTGIGVDIEYSLTSASG